MDRDSLTRLRLRIEDARVDAIGDVASELDLALAELEALWQALEHEADVLAAERLRHTRIFHHAPFACVITDWYGSVREANLAALDLLEVPATYLLRKPLALFIVDDMKDGFRRRLAQMVAKPREVWQPFVVALRLPGDRQKIVELGARELPVAEGRPDLIWFIRGEG